MQTDIVITEYSSPLGLITIAANQNNITGLWFSGQKYFMQGAENAKKGNSAVFAQTKKWLDIYFSGKEPSFTPPIEPGGSEFRLAVFKTMLDIPRGKVSTYGEIARAIEKNTGRKTSARAVGSAVGHNPISVIIPCHRVVGANGRLTGYAGGLDTKRKLLELEGIIDGIF